MKDGNEDFEKKKSSLNGTHHREVENTSLIFTEKENS